MTEPTCIDISHWQGFPDFKKVKSAGVIACIMKATEGIHFVDPNRAKNFVEATKAGIACCCYFWLKPHLSAAQQAQFFLDTVKPVHGERVVIDWEETPLSLNELCEAIRTLNAANKNLQVTIYCSQSPLMTMLANVPQDAFDLLKETDLWVAHYTSAPTPGPTPAKIWPSWSLWQYSEKGTVDGIEGHAVDLNRFNGSNTQLLKWMQPAGPSEPVVAAPAAPPPAPEENAVSINVWAPNTKITVQVNGVVYQPPSTS